MGPNFMDEIDCGNFFDQIDDLIEFPPDNECGVGGAGDFVGPAESKDFPSMWSDVLPVSDPLFSGCHGDGPTDISTELSVPYEDIVQLEWLSTFVEDSFSGGGLTIGKENLCVNKSPISVLESSSSSTSSCSGPGKTIPLSPSHHRGPQRARSKRPRPATFNPRAAIQLISPSSSFISENFAESPTRKKGPKLAGLEQKKKKKIRISLPADPDGTHQNAPVRKCLHCEITKTPQWRAGPMGPKTLCNACGVRYKSGRLFPEYRPAASPTFVPSLHSNSHKKVIEMRCKVGPETTPAASKPGIVPKPEIAPNP
ncbi:gata transcription factor 9 [Phtheirospermum japonicum]|uniref:GATA transcription factor n=1 Tax=Phtheirospermum japonicum TaxID=374723 RepID=A0A830BCM5_9LAMI|nr:gata transcription factor 9 [Phtheirospermum japonicum]